MCFFVLNVKVQKCYITHSKISHFQLIVISVSPSSHLPELSTPGKHGDMTGLVPNHLPIHRPASLANSKTFVVSVVQITGLSIVGDVRYFTYCFFVGRNFDFAVITNIFHVALNFRRWCNSPEVRTCFTFFTWFFSVTIIFGGSRTKTNKLFDFPDNVG